MLLPGEQGLARGRGRDAHHRAAPSQVGSQTAKANASNCARGCLQLISRVNAFARTDRGRADPRKSSSATGEKNLIPDRAKGYAWASGPTHPQTVTLNKTVDFGNGSGQVDSNSRGGEGAAAAPHGTGTVDPPEVGWWRNVQDPDLYPRGYASIVSVVLTNHGEHSDCTHEETLKGWKADGESSSNEFHYFWGRPDFQPITPSHWNALHVHLARKQRARLGIRRGELKNGAQGKQAAGAR
eukprot:674627-Rhodomonas_salina.1